MRAGLARLFLLAAMLFACASVPARAVPLDPLQLADARVQTIGWKLARGNAAYCARVRPAIGLLLQDVQNYDDPAKARSVLGLTGDIAVEAVAEGSPAAAAGLEANDQVLAIDGMDMADLPPARKGGWQRLFSLHDRIDAALVRDGRIALTVIHGGAERRLVIAGEPACAVRFELDMDMSVARATRDRVVVGYKLYRELGGDEALLAAAMAHEFAHAVLDHQSLLDTLGRGMNKVRHTEEEADRLSVWLLANAGYDPQDAERFMQSWGKAHDLGIFGMPDHNRPGTRATMIADEIATLHAAQARDPGHAANWPRDFVRQRI